MSCTVLVAGAGGALGSHVVRLAAARGWRVKALVRSPDKLPADVRARLTDVYQADARSPYHVHGICEGVDAVFSSMGASVSLDPRRGWQGFRGHDWPANVNLIDEAERARVARFVYVSVFHTPAMRRLAYVDAHERVVDRLRGSPLSWAVLRPTGFFSAIVGEYARMAQRGAIPELGDGSTRTNPIADEDLAALCVDALDNDAPTLELDAGGPDVITRHDLGALAFAAAARPPRYRRLPLGLARFLAPLLAVLHPRIGQFFQFAVDISGHDLIAPARGARRLVDAFHLGS